jgi:hypothetical protein
MTNIQKLPPAPAMKAPTEEGASRDAIFAIVDSQTASLVREIRHGIQILQDTETEILREAVRLKTDLQTFAGTIEHLNRDNAERARNLEQLRADRAELVNAKVAG